MGAGGAGHLEAKKEERIHAVRSGGLHTWEPEPGGLPPTSGQVAVPPSKAGIRPALQKRTGTLHAKTCKTSSHWK